MFKLRLLISTLILSFLFLQSSYAEVYRWKDENGKIHFSDKPHSDATRLDIKAPKSSGIGISQKQSQRRKELLESFQEKNDAQKEQALNNKNKQATIDRQCKYLRDQLKNYEEVDYLFIRDTKGEKQNLSDERKKIEEQKLRSQIDENC